MDKALLDTDIYSEVLKARSISVRRNAEAYREVHEQYTISAITVMEVVKGFQRLGRNDRVQVFMASLSAQEILPFDQEAALLAGRVAGDLERTGQPIGRADPMVAAIAIRHGLVLVTGNTRHFDRIMALGYALELLDWRI